MNGAATQEEQGKRPEQDAGDRAQKDRQRVREWVRRWWWVPSVLSREDVRSAVEAAADAVAALFG